MSPRMTNPAMLVPNALPNLLGLGKALAEARSGELPPSLVHLVHLRASQINGCSYCVVMHTKEAQKVGETLERIVAVSAWRETSYFTDAERAALSLAEAMTRLSDRSDPVSDEVWDAVSKHFSESELAALILEVATVNLWNRVNAATRQAAA